jgi:YggT family protein|tara:strand:- start:7385 stop:7672 length:288 start_codon:yes stop_codon:yes gene_type:complete
VTTLIFVLIGGLVGFLKLFQTLLTVRIYSTWFPNLNLYEAPFSYISKMTDPYLKVFRGISPPIFGIDPSPILAFVAVGLILEVLEGVSETNAIIT